ncbi:ubiquinol-cytochrome c reductase subunit 8 [Ilyonectria robusta]
MPYSRRMGNDPPGTSANSMQVNPWAGSVHAAIFNTFRRTKGQIFYWLPPMIAGYYLMDWATERYGANVTGTASKLLTNKFAATTTTSPRPAVPSLAMRRNRAPTDWKRVLE